MKSTEDAKCEKCLCTRVFKDSLFKSLNVLKNQQKKIRYPTPLRYVTNRSIFKPKPKSDYLLVLGSKTVLEISNNLIEPGLKDFKHPVKTLKIPV